MEVIKAYGVRHEGEDFAVPATFVVSQEGKIVYSHVGESQIDRPKMEGLALIIESL